jgi:hypothetical protein
VRRIEEDYQAISWKTHDNEREVLAALSHLLQFLPQVRRNSFGEPFLLTNDTQAEEGSVHLRTLLNHKAVESLLAYFAADVRRNVRLIILQMLGTISAVAPASVTRSMALVLPPLICTDILAIVAATDESVIDVEWLMFSALLLTCCLNAEEDGMIIHHQYFAISITCVCLADGTPFFSSLSAAIVPDVPALLKCFFELLEKGCPDATAEIDGSTVDSTLLTCLLTINTKLPRQDLLSGADDDADNDTLRTLLAQESSQRFIQLLLSVFNESANNPVLFAPSVIFVRDLLVHPVACHLFYQNDLCVLVDVVLRHMSNIAEDHPQRYQLLEITFGLVRNCDLVKLDYKLAELTEVVRWQAENESADERNAPLAASVLEMLTTPSS